MLSLEEGFKKQKNDTPIVFLGKLVGVKDVTDKDAKSELERNALVRRSKIAKLGVDDLDLSSVLQSYDTVHFIVKNYLGVETTMPVGFLTSNVELYTILDCAKQFMMVSKQADRKLNINLLKPIELEKSMCVVVQGGKALTKYEVNGTNIIKTKDVLGDSIESSGYVVLDNFKNLASFFSYMSANKNKKYFKNKFAKLGELVGTKGVAFNIIQFEEGAIDCDGVVTL